MSEASPAVLTAGSGRGLSAAAAARYRTDGCLFPVPAIAPERASELRRKLEAVEASQGGALPRAMLLKPHLLFTWLDALIRDPGILDPVEALLGPDLLCWSTRFFIKDPRDGGFLAWHQDVTFWGLEVSDAIITAWVALTPATPENGVMKVVPGTHRSLVLHQEGRKSSMLQRGQEIAVEVDEAKAIHMSLRPGEMSLHHGLIFHSSDENLSDDRRIGVAIRYIPTSLKPLEGLPRDHASLVRGVDRYGHFEPERRPVADLDPAAVEHHRFVSERYLKIHDLAAERHERMVGTRL